MKKILLTIAVAITVMSCSKNNDDSDKYVSETLDIQEFVNLIDKSVSDVKATYKGNLIDETSTLGKTKLSYQYPTKEKEYLSSFKFDTDGKLKEVVIGTTEEMNYSDGINFTKVISDRIANIYKNKSYSAYAYSKKNGDAMFTEREKFWQYIADHKVDDSMDESWFLINAEEVGEKLVYETLTLHYLGDSKTFLISVEKKEY